MIEVENRAEVVYIWMYFHSPVCSAKKKQQFIRTETYFHVFQVKYASVTTVNEIIKCASLACRPPSGLKKPQVEPAKYWQNLTWSNYSVKMKEIKRKSEKLFSFCSLTSPKSKRFFGVPCPSTQKHFIMSRYCYVILWIHNLLGRDPNWRTS